MVALPRDQAATITGYLARNFPVKPAPEAVVIPGTAKVTIREWVVPTLGSRPHDPLAAADGSLWWTGQFASRLGRLDPKTGAMKEYPLKTADSGPHGLVEDSAGNIWFTGISQNYIGKLDPKTGGVTEYRVPEGNRGPHTPIFYKNGTLWFTLQSGAVGRLSPRTGEEEGLRDAHAQRQHVSVRHRGELQGHSVVRRFPRRQARQHRSRNDEDYGTHASECGCAPATHRPHSG